ncbi:MAG TPA: energy transducer TonB [Bacteroidia bacterium]|jgi:TonB family protein|nr:energy transducer TonB [Bacteroidia bacterium]
MIQRFENLKIWKSPVTISSVFILFIFCRCSSGGSVDSKTLLADSICEKWTKTADSEIKEGRYYITLSQLPRQYGPYAEEMFYIYYGKKVYVHSGFLVLVDNMGIENDSCYRKEMLNAVEGFGSDVLKRVADGSDSLFKTDSLRYNVSSPGAAKFPGGDSLLRTLLSRNVRYPTSARRDGITGSVLLKLKIDTVGKIYDIIVIRSVRKDLDSAAIAGVKMLPNFQPALNRGRRDTSFYAIPVKFQLTK